MQLKPDVVIVRYGEIALKSQRTRNRYEHILISNIKKMLDLNNVDYSEVTRDQGRIFIHTTDKAAVDVTSKVLGVVSVSPAVTTTSMLDDITKLAAEVGGQVIRHGESFAIRARRAGVHEFTSIDIAQQCGGAVIEKVGDKHTHVNLSSPDKQIFVEVRQRHSYVHTEVVKGMGGLPVGTQGKMVALISGGIDSPVAAWLMMKRGCEIVFVYCNNEPFSDESNRERAMECIEALQVWSPRKLKVYEAANGKNLEAFLDTCKESLLCVLCRRMMYRIAGEIMKKEGAYGIITGSSLGQVASQTSENMMTEIYTFNYPIYHPLIGLDKKEIITIAQRIGTYEPSIKPAKECSVVPDHPATAAKISDVLEAEENLNIKQMLQHTLEHTKKL
ncbi:MAG: tRNA sulfurtransferase [Candidatus Argoarchaeum ethanivorans]|uniref:Probable tRNA sulfurtransferase n=1 Tax=Candidatus Argoarchaeum ethanivorans TaxID=2608793 RepID=A0A811TH40_9EURY|nr:MAG: tRNA sulfurtransferase [Candidatus Argoarchaeum ethanivorans]